MFHRLSDVFSCYHEDRVLFQWAAALLFSIVSQGAFCFCDHHADRVLFQRSVADCFFVLSSCRPSFVSAATSLSSLVSSRRSSFVSTHSSRFFQCRHAEGVFISTSNSRFFFLLSSCISSSVSMTGSPLFLVSSGRWSLFRRTAVVFFFQCRHAYRVFVSAISSRFFLFVVVLLIGPNGLLVVVFATTSMGGVRFCSQCSSMKPRRNRNKTRAD